MEVEDCNPEYGSHTEFDSKKCNTQALCEEGEERKLRGLRSAADFPLQVVSSMGLLIQLGQQVTTNDFFVVENLEVDMLLETTFIDKNIKNTYPKREVVVPTGSCPVALETQPDSTPQSNIMSRKLGQ